MMFDNYIYQHTPDRISFSNLVHESKSQNDKLRANLSDLSFTKLTGPRQLNELRHVGQQGLGLGRTLREVVYTLSLLRLSLSLHRLLLLLLLLEQLQGLSLRLSLLLRSVGFGG